MAAVSPEPNGQAKRTHRGWVWTLIVVAAVLATLSIAANWLQTQLLDDQQWHDNTQQIVEDQDVQDALSQYLVTQLFASVDVSQQLETTLPPPVNKLSPQLSGVVQQLAQNAADRLLESPRIQSLIINASDRAHDQLVKLLDDKDKYIDTNNGEVVLDLSGVINDLAVQLGLNPSTVAEVQSFVQGEIKDLNSKLTQLDDSIATLDQSLATYSGGALSSSQQQDVDQAQSKISGLQSSLNKVQSKLSSTQGKLPPKLQNAAKKLESALSQLSAKLAPLDQQLTAVKQNPTETNVAELRTTLGSMQTNIAKIQSRPILQNPGQLVLVQSSAARGCADSDPPAASPGLRPAPAGRRPLPARAVPGARLAARGPDRHRRRDLGGRLGAAGRVQLARQQRDRHAGGQRHQPVGCHLDLGHPQQ